MVNELQKQLGEANVTKTGSEIEQLKLQAKHTEEIASLHEEIKKLRESQYKIKKDQYEC